MIEQVTAGFDWLTLTLPLGALLDQEWVYKSLQCLDEVVHDGYPLEYSKLNGYDGVKAGGCFVGTRFDGHMVQFSGRYANIFFERLYRYDAHISRCDMQVSVKYKKMPQKVAKEAYRDATTENKTIPVARRRKLFIIVGSDGGDTFYLGSTSAPARGRLYNKEVQSEDPLYARTWRYEVVLRNEHATRFCGDYAARTDDKALFLSNWCAVWWQTRGVHTPWVEDDQLLPIPPIKTLPTDVEKKLNWLAHQVRPTVEFLLTVRSRDEILALLGLADVPPADAN